MPMSQQQAVAFLEKSKYFLTRQLQDLDAALAQVREAPDDGAANAVMAGEVARAMAFHDEELAALQGWAGGAPVARPAPPPTLRTAAQPQPQSQQREQQAAAGASDSPRSRSNMEARLLAMGAVPTLGGILRQPARAQLNATASPAARELLRRRLNTPDGGIIASVGSGGAAPRDSHDSESGCGHGGSQPGSPSTPSWQASMDPPARFLC